MMQMLWKKNYKVILLQTWNHEMWLSVNSLKPVKNKITSYWIMETNSLSSFHSLISEKLNNRDKKVC